MTNQITTHNLAIDTGDGMLGGWVENGALSLQKQNNHPYFKCNWSASDINSAWTDPDDRGAVNFRILGPLSTEWFAQLHLQRRFESSSAQLWFGDWNQYPGIRSENNGMTIKFDTTGGLDPSTTANHSQVGHWLAVFGEMTSTGTVVATTREEVRLRGLTTDLSSNNARLTGNIQVGDGMGFVINKYYCAEFSYWYLGSRGDSNNLQNIYVGNRARHVNQLVVNFGNQTHTYSS